MKTIVLVHGSWMDASCWNKVIPLLEKAGNEVIALNLPGHGSDNTPTEKLTMQSYANAVVNAIGHRTGIILVGHSMGGMVISLAAEQIPGKIKKLIYICARLPANGQSLLMLASMDPHHSWDNH
ncbi:MAG: alpha/beta fold hydrolase [Ignavibacteria bacterium]